MRQEILDLMIEYCVVLQLFLHQHVVHVKLRPQFGHNDIPSMKDKVL